ARRGAVARPRTRPGSGANRPGRRARRPPHLHGDARAAADRRRARLVEAVLGANVRIRVGHLYPEYLNIYADRGNIAVLTRRAALRGHECAVAAISVGDAVDPGAHDLLYIGGGQDREQALIAPDLVEKGPAIEAAVDAGAALLAVCGGYQLLGRGYVDQHGESLPGVGLFPHDTVAGERRMIGDVLLVCEIVAGDGRTISAVE